MQKIKIVNNSFELPFVDEEGTDYSHERIIVNKIIDLIKDYTCFATSRCNDEVLSSLKTINYIKTGKYDKTLELKEFPEIKEALFEDVAFYFMPKEFSFDKFLSINVFCDIYKKYNAKLFVVLNEFGFVFIRYNSMYNEKIRNIIGEENIKQPFFKRKCKKKFRN